MKFLTDFKKRGSSGKEEDGDNDWNDFSVKKVVVVFKKGAFNEMNYVDGNHLSCKILRFHSEVSRTLTVRYSDVRLLNKFVFLADFSEQSLNFELVVASCRNRRTKLTDLKIDDSNVVKPLIGIT